MKIRSLIVTAIVTMPALAFAQRTITVMGDGNAESKPDFAMVTLMISAQDQTAQSSFVKLDDGTARMRKAMTDAGVSGSDIEQQGVALNPSYDYSGGGGTPPRLSGYHLMGTYTIKVRSLKDLPKVIDAASLAGASNVSISSYGVVDKEKLEEQATKKALDEAHEKAERMAEEMGGKLGEIISISDAIEAAPSGGMGREEEEEHRGGGMIVAGLNAQRITRSVELKVTYSVK